MDCPYCNKEMKMGYIQSSNPLGWNSKKRIIWALSGILPDQELGRSIVAYKCGDCKKIIIDYSQVFPFVGRIKISA